MASIWEGKPQRSGPALGMFITDPHQNVRRFLRVLKPASHLVKVQA